MNNTERGLKIIDIFTDLREHVNKVKGKIHQGEGYIHENPTCGTAACIGGWLADYFKTKVHFDIYADHKFYRHYQNGITKLADKLDLDVKHLLCFFQDYGIIPMKFSTQRFMHITVMKCITI